jgi:hypothetical protein
VWAVVLGELHREDTPPNFPLPEHNFQLYLVSSSVAGFFAIMDLQIRQKKGNEPESSRAGVCLKVFALKQRPVRHSAA